MKTTTRVITKKERKEALKILHRLRKSRKREEVIKLFSDKNPKIRYSGQDPWTYCIITSNVSKIDDSILGVGGAKRCTYRPTEDKPCEPTGKQIAFNKAIKSMAGV